MLSENPPFGQSQSPKWLQHGWRELSKYLTRGGSFDSLWLVCGEQETQKTPCVLKRGRGGSVNTESNGSGVQTKVVENQYIVILLYSFLCFRKTQVK